MISQNINNWLLWGSLLQKRLAVDDFTASFAHKQSVVVFSLPAWMVSLLMHLSFDLF